MTRILSLDDLPRLALGDPRGDELSARLESIAGGVITIGNFDGVHLGHATLLHKFVNWPTNLVVPQLQSSWIRTQQPFCDPNLLIEG